MGSDAAAGLAAGVALFNAGRYEEAARLFGSCDGSSAEARLMLAHALRWSGRVPRAIEVVSELLSRRPRHARGWLCLGELRMAGGPRDRRSAALAFRRALRADPGLAEAHRGLARLHALGSRLDLARDALGRARRIRPDDPTIARELDAVEAQSRSRRRNRPAAPAAISGTPPPRRLDRAAKALGRYVREHPADLPARTRLARFLFDQGRDDQALRASRRALELGDGRPEALAQHAEFLTRLGRLGEARRALRGAGAARSSVRVLVMLGRLHDRAGRRREALSCFRRAARWTPRPPLSRDPHLAADLLLHRLQARLRLGRWGPAFEDAEAVLDLDRGQRTLDELAGALNQAAPGRLREPLIRRLKALRRGRRGGPWPALYAALAAAAGDPNEARASMRGWERLPRRYGWMRYWRGVSRLLGGRARAARAEFRAALASAPGMWSARAQLAEIAICGGRTARGLGILGGLARRLGRHERAEAAAWRGEMLLFLGRYRDALRSLDPAVRGGAVFARAWRGAALLQLGRPGRALAELDRYLRTRPDDVEALVWRGEALRRLGRLPESIACLGRALAAGPDNPWALANLGLAAGARGDEEGLRRSIRSLPPFVRRFLERRAAPGTRSRDAGCALLRDLLELGRGVRRAEPHLRPLWLRARR